MPAIDSKPLTVGELEARNVLRLAGHDIPSDPRRRTRMDAALAQTWGAGAHEAWHDEAGQCRICRAPIDSQLITLGCGIFAAKVRETICDACHELAKEHYSGRAVTNTQATPDFDEQCPSSTREIIESGNLSASVDRDGYARVLRWRPSDGKGLAILGPQGSGKTLAMWGLFRELEREGFSPKLLTAVQLGRILSEAARDIREVSWLYNCRVLMVDDLGKERLTPSVAALLWEVLDKRYGLGRPLVLTTRFTGAEMIQRFGELHLGEDIRRRLNELCSGVHFQLNKSP